MLKLEFWEDEDKKEDGYQYHCCGVDDSEVEGTLNTWCREVNYEIAKEKMLDNLKRLRDDIDNLIKAEEKTAFVREIDADNTIKEERNKALDELINKMKSRYFHMVGNQFDNAILEMEKFAELLKNN